MALRGTLVVALALAAASPARAEILALTFHGTIDRIDGDAALLGSPAAGAAYRLVYRADFSRGRRGGGGGGFAGANYIIGGTSQPPDDDFPRARLSPLSAILTVGGQSHAFAGTSFGELMYIYDSFDIQFGGTGSSRAGITADDDPASAITTVLESDRFDTFFQSVEEPLSVVVDGGIVTGETIFSLAGGAVSGRLVPTSYSAAVVPEPAIWVLLVGGFGLVGIGLRRQTRTDNQPR